jgi:hypothetical protein
MIVVRFRPHEPKHEATNSAPGGVPSLGVLFLMASSLAQFATSPLSQALRSGGRREAGCDASSVPVPGGIGVAAFGVTTAALPVRWRGRDAADVPLSRADLYR